MGVAWDLFGNGKTSVKWNMGKYLSGAAISGIYADANPAQRTVNLHRTWTDVDGDRSRGLRPAELRRAERAGGTSAAGRPRSRAGQHAYGRDPLSLDAAGTPIGLATTQCGRREAGIPADVQAYCDVYGESLLDGWGKAPLRVAARPRHPARTPAALLAEVTYNRRSYSNLTVTDQLGIGCDRFNGARTCGRARRAT